MLKVYARTREREKAWKLGALCLGASALGAPVMMLIFQERLRWGWREVSIYSLNFTNSSHTDHIIHLALLDFFHHS